MTIFRWNIFTSSLMVLPYLFARILLFWFGCTLFVLLDIVCEMTIALAGGDCGLRALLEMKHSPLRFFCWIDLLSEPEIAKGTHMNQVEVATHTGLILPAWGKKVAKHPPKKERELLGLLMLFQHRC